MRVTELVAAALVAAAALAAPEAVAAEQAALDPRIIPAMRTVPRDGKTWVKPIVADAMKDMNVAVWLRKLKHVMHYEPRVAREEEAEEAAAGRDDAALLAPEENPCSLLKSDDANDCRANKGDPIYDKDAARQALGADIVLKEMNLRPNYEDAQE